VSIDQATVFGPSEATDNDRIMEMTDWSAVILQITDEHTLTTDLEL
jgi:hypothetical protein